MEEELHSTPWGTTTPEEIATPGTIPKGGQIFWGITLAVDGTPAPGGITLIQEEDTPVLVTTRETADPDTTHPRGLAIQDMETVVMEATREMVGSWDIAVMMGITPTGTDQEM